MIAPESVGFTDNFANAMLNTATMANFEVYGGHQYGLMQSAYKQFQNYNKEIWQTEYLINWNSGSQTPRDFNWNLDAFNFASSINNSMLGNINAWIHYASKRYYGLMGDGTNGTAAGVITKEDIFFLTLPNIQPEKRVLQQPGETVRVRFRVFLHFFRRESGGFNGH